MVLDFSIKDTAYFANYTADWQLEILDFLKKYQDSSTTITVHTSGSTGKPKAIEIQKEHLKNSAKMTGHFFELKPGNTALLCLPVQYIAGKMMLIRALELQLKLYCVAPTTTVLETISLPIDFAAMVPIQVEKSIKKLNIVKKLLIGGAVVSATLEEKLQQEKTACYASYGMTETVSHIALRRLNGAEKSKYYTTLKNVAIKQNEQNCLIIHCSKLNNNEIVTNDVVKITAENQFEFLGRLDNVINSGGLKIHPEILEKKIEQIIPKNRFFIASEADEILQEKVILIIEKESVINELEDLLATICSKYENPKAIYYLSKFIETPTQKINRKQTLKMILS